MARRVGLLLVTDVDATLVVAGLSFEGEDGGEAIHGDVSQFVPSDLASI